MYLFSDVVRRLYLSDTDSSSVSMIPPTPNGSDVERSDESFSDADDLHVLEDSDADDSFEALLVCNKQYELAIADWFGPDDKYIVLSRDSESD
jgi:hypothetical protein